MTYTITTSIEAPVEEVISETTKLLKSEGFGVLADIDVQATFEQNIDEEIDQYRILGACNPSLAHEGITAESDLGALLPCNVAIYEDENDDVVVSAGHPNQLLEITENPALNPIADDVKSRFERVFEELEAQFVDGGT
ncbi:MAG: DUF302 domain-containing protein [Halodesulfurarchaeum sp.]